MISDVAPIRCAGSGTRLVVRSAPATARGCCTTSPAAPVGVRQVARAVVQVAPLGALVTLVLGSGWITCTALIGGLVMALIYSVAYFDQSAAHRLFKHGYPRGTAQRIHSERVRAKDPDRVRRYMQTYRNQAT
jgi:hypothetical protein